MNAGHTCWRDIARILTRLGGYACMNAGLLSRAFWIGTSVKREFAVDQHGRSSCLHPRN
jgi:hypothetical protein